MKKLSIITLFLVMSSSMYSQLLGPLINSDRFVVFARTGTAKRESLASDIRKYVLKANDGLRIVDSFVVKGSDSKTLSKNSHYLNHKFNHIGDFSESWVGTGRVAMNIDQFGTFRLNTDVNNDVNKYMHVFSAAFNFSYTGFPISPTDITDMGANSTVSGGYGNTIKGVNNAFIGNGQANKIFFLGHNSSIAGGFTNCISGGSNNFIGGGTTNTITAGVAVLAGGYLNKVLADFSVISGGSQNTVSGQKAVISGGELNVLTGTYGVISGGSNNQATGYGSIIVGGTANKSTSGYTFVGGGSQNTASANSSSVLSGNQNIASGDYSVVGSGTGNTCSGFKSSIVGGLTNLVQGQTSSILSGYSNKVITGSESSAIVAGQQNNVSSVRSYIGAGFNNTVSGSGSSVSSGSENVVTSFNSFNGAGSSNVLTASESFNAAGKFGVTSAAYQSNLGTNNVAFSGQNVTGYNSTDLLFTVGNGLGDVNNRSNALTMTKEGRTQINSAQGFPKTQAQLTPNAAFEVVSSTSGTLAPRMTNMQIISYMNTLNLSSDVTGGANGLAYSKRGMEIECVDCVSNDNTTAGVTVKIYPNPALSGWVMKKLW